MSEKDGKWRDEGNNSSFKVESLLKIYKIIDYCTVLWWSFISTPLYRTLSASKHTNHKLFRLVFSNKAMIRFFESKLTWDRTLGCLQTRGRESVEDILSVCRSLSLLVHSLALMMIVKEMVDGGNVIKVLLLMFFRNRRYARYCCVIVIKFV